MERTQKEGTPPPALELSHISKSFGEVKANRDISLTVHRGEILSILGENGSGKSTLMNIIAGIYTPDQGSIAIDGEKAEIHSPKDAYRYRIGMIHQHYKLVDVFTATENIILGLKDRGGYRIRQSEDAIREICSQYGFRLDPKKKIYQMSVSEKQMVEIIKVLYRGSELLILDEPTAVLTPQEIDNLFQVLRRMREDGKAIIIITHKLNEVMEISDRVSVLHKGKLVATVETKNTDEKQLTEMMVGHPMDLAIRRPKTDFRQCRLRVDHLDLTDPQGLPLLHDISFQVYAGEILGIAGISGSGQKELLETIAGLNHASHGQVTYLNPGDGREKNLLDLTPDRIRELGVRLSFVPEDRLGMGLVGNMNLTDNMLLRSFDQGHQLVLNRKKPKALAEDLVERLHIVTPDVNTPLRRLSGGNVQKVLVGREMAASPSLLMVAYPVRGLDINSSYQIYDLLNEEKKKGVAIIYVGEDLDVMLSLCDRILVMAQGQVTGLVNADESEKEELGLLMTQAGQYVRRTGNRKENA